MAQIEITIGELDENTRLFPLVLQIRQPVEAETIFIMLASPWLYGFEIVSFRHFVVLGYVDALIKIEGTQVRFTGDAVAGVPTAAPPAVSSHTPDQTLPAYALLNESVTLQTDNLGTGTESYIAQFTCRVLKPAAA